MILALLLCCAALSETLSQYVTAAGYTPSRKGVKSQAATCHFEEKGNTCAVTWTEGGTQYRIVESKNPGALRELYVKMLSMKAWEQCLYVVNGTRMYGYNVTKNVINVCDSFAGYRETLSAYIYGYTPRPTATPTPTPTPRSTPRPTVKPTAKPKAQSQSSAQHYVLNTNTKKFHDPTCSYANRIKASNRKDVTQTRQQVVRAR